MTEETQSKRSDILNHTTEIVAAYATNHSLDQAELVSLIQSVFSAVSGLAEEPAAPETLVPAVSLRKSITDDYLICLEDGHKLKTLKRHLMTSYGMTPEEYRAKWGLPQTYPMIAPAYTRRRQEIAKQIGLGRRGRQVEAPVQLVKAPAPKARRTRAKAAA